MKVKEQEIRIGNLFYKVVDNFVECPPKIIAWDAQNWYSIGECLEFLDWFSPIPITEELLLKAGFEYCHFTVPDQDGVYRQKKAPNKDYFKHPNLNEKITYYLPYYDLNYYIGNTAIRYIHQLQNLIYSLTGSELTFKQ